MFPKQYHALDTFSQMPKNQIYSTNAIMIANVFKYLPKSKAAVLAHVPLKSCSEVFKIIHSKTPVQEFLFVRTIFFHCFISSLPSYSLKKLFIHSRSNFFFLLH